jgi:hypothetical protein
MSDARDPVAYSFSKDRLAKGWSYPMKRSALDHALFEAGATSVASVTFSRDTRPLSHPHRPPLSVQYHGENAPYAMAGCCVISVKSVPSESRFIIAEALATRLGDVARWIANIVEQTPTWRAEGHGLLATVIGGELRLEEELPRSERRR